MVRFTQNHTIEIYLERKLRWTFNKIVGKVKEIDEKRKTNLKTKTENKGERKPYKLICYIYKDDIQTKWITNGILWEKQMPEKKKRKKNI